MEIKIANITQNKTYFTREQIDQELVDEYMELIQNDVKFPPVLVSPAQDGLGVNFDLLNGFHTYFARLNLRKEFIEVEVCNVAPGVERFLEGVKRNSKHGKPLSSKDKRRNIERIFEYEDARNWSDACIAAAVGTSDRTVANVRKGLPSPKISELGKIKCMRNGRPHEVARPSVAASASNVAPALDSIPLDPEAGEGVAEILKAAMRSVPSKEVQISKLTEKSDAQQGISKIDDRVEMLEGWQKEMIESMRALEKVCQRFIMGFRKLNDGKERSTAEALMKLQNQVLEMGECVGAITAVEGQRDLKGQHVLQ